MSNYMVGIFLGCLLGSSIGLIIGIELGERSIQYKLIESE